MTVRYVIAFEPVRSGRFRSPPICRLKGLLKTSLRGWGLRAVAVREELKTDQELSERVRLAPSA